MAIVADFNDSPKQYGKAFTLQLHLSLPIPA